MDMDFSALERYVAKPASPKARGTTHPLHGKPPARPDLPANIRGRRSGRTIGLGIRVTPVERERLREVCTATRLPLASAVLIAIELLQREHAAGTLPVTLRGINVA